MDTPALVTVRFTTCRSTLTSCHYAGVDYEVPADFARQVVDEEGCAEYVAGGPVLASSGRPRRERLSRRR